MKEILLWIYFGLVLIALPCCLYLFWQSLKYMIEELWLFANEEPNLILFGLRLILGGLVGIVVLAVEMVLLGIIALIPFWNLWLFGNYGCEIKNPFYKKA